MSYTVKQRKIIRQIREYRRRLDKAHKKIGDLQVNIAVLKGKLLAQGIDYDEVLEHYYNKRKGITQMTKKELDEKYEAYK